ncbi:MAG: DNA-processing protein DprA [Saccharofermentanales bacterium]
MEQYSNTLEGALWISGLMKYASPGGNAIRKALEYFSGITGLYNANDKELIEVIGSPPEKVGKTRLYLKNADNRRHAAEEAAVFGRYYGDAGIKALSSADIAYPNKLKEISSAPAILYYCTHEDISRLNDGCSIAIVGTRTPTQYGISVTDKIVSGFSDRNINIISGMARGIDSLAHESALRSRIFTAAVLGCGLDIVYPPENKDLMLRIIDCGVVLSECPPGTLPARSYFPARNRIISGISDCTVVTEASSKSGTMITAGFAADQGRDVYAVPGSIFSPQSTGTNKLIQDGANVLTCAEDLLSSMAGLKYQYINTLFGGYSAGEEFSDTDISLTGKTADTDDMTAQNSMKCRNLLRNMEMSIEEIAAELNMPVEIVSGIISVAELAGEVICRKGRFILTESYKSSIK